MAQGILVFTSLGAAIAAGWYLYEPYGADFKIRKRTNLGLAFAIAKRAGGSTSS